MIKYLLILLCANLSAQAAGASFLLLSPSPTNNSLGGSNVSSNTYDLYTSYSNPAHSLINEGLSAQSSSAHLQLLPSLYNDRFIKTNVKRISYSGDAIFKSNSYDFQISFTQSDQYQSLGVQNLGYFISYRTSKAKTISLGFKSKNKPIYFSIGITKKDVFQNLGNYNYPGFLYSFYSFQSNTKMYDWGYRMAIHNYSLKNINFLDVSSSIGYSKNNITDKFIEYTGEGPTLKELAPRVARLGLSFGVRIRPFKNFENLPISINFNREAESLLIKELTFQNSVYDDSMLGAMKIGENIFKGNSTPDVDIHKGREINIFNIYYIRNGQHIHYSGNRNTEGYSIRYSRSALLFLSIFKSPDTNTFNNLILNNLYTFLNLIDIDYNNCKWNTSETIMFKEFEETTFTLKYEF